MHKIVWSIALKGGGCSQYLKNQTTPDPNNTVSWSIYATVEDKNLQNPSTIRISLFVKSSYKLSGSYWTNLALPVINVKMIFFLNIFLNQ